MSCCWYLTYAFLEFAQGGSGKKSLVTQSTNDPDPTFLVDYSIHSIGFHLSNMSKVIFGYGNELL
jgi:hypothetical protein